MNPARPRVKLESWVEETERKVRLIIDHYPRCTRCNKILLGSATRPWRQECHHCKFVNKMGEVVS